LVASSHTGILYVAWGCFQKFKKLENYPPPRCASQDSEPQAAPPQFALARLSVQEQEGKQADYNSAAARVNAAAAEVAADQGEVDRLQALESFKRIVAPFDGVVTAGETDIGGHSAARGRVRAMSALAPIADSECSAFMSARPAFADFTFAKLAAACKR
jgi:multidrug efflux pump subunit AcrA (membrane-fusion protein)